MRTSSIQDLDNALICLAAQTADRIDFIFQVKAHLGLPRWSKDFAKLTRRANRREGEARRRSRPLEMLKTRMHRRLRAMGVTSGATCPQPLTQEMSADRESQIRTSISNSLKNAVRRAPETIAAAHFNRVSPEKLGVEPKKCYFATETGLAHKRDSSRGIHNDGCTLRSAS
jgi:hypothetical protein